MTISSRLSACASAALLVASAHAATPALPGAIFTTDQRGNAVNGNAHYLRKCGVNGVYLDGGPGPNSPPNAASLPDGDYYFQVTDASGTTLASPRYRVRAGQWSRARAAHRRATAHQAPCSMPLQAQSSTSP